MILSINGVSSSAGAIFSSGQYFLVLGATFAQHLKNEASKLAMAYTDH